MFLIVPKSRVHPPAQPSSLLKNIHSKDDNATVPAFRSHDSVFKSSPRVQNACDQCRLRKSKVPPHVHIAMFVGILSTEYIAHTLGLWQSTMSDSNLHSVMDERHVVAARNAMPSVSTIQRRFRLAPQRSPRLPRRPCFSVSKLD